MRWRPKPAPKLAPAPAKAHTPPAATTASAKPAPAAPVPSGQPATAFQPIPLDGPRVIPYGEGGLTIPGPDGKPISFYQARDQRAFPHSLQRSGSSFRMRVQPGDTAQGDDAYKAPKPPALPSPRNRMELVQWKGAWPKFPPRRWFSFRTTITVLTPLTDQKRWAGCFQLHGGQGLPQFVLGVYPGRFSVSHRTGATAQPAGSTAAYGPDEPPYVVGQPQAVEIAFCTDRRPFGEGGTGGYVVKIGGRTVLDYHGPTGMDDHPEGPRAQIGVYAGEHAEPIEVQMDDPRFD